MFPKKMIPMLMTLLLLLSFSAGAEQIPVSMKGKIITNQNDIDIPASNLVKKLNSQDRKVIARSEGRWTVHLVAFFNKPLPTERMGIVVLDSKQEPVAVAQVGGAKGQKTLATHIDIDSTESPGTKHVIRVYYAKSGKAITLAEKNIVLK